ncbi:MAG: cbb3-type cytochrome c oxidase subunit I [Opitutaceae bacterium]
MTASESTTAPVPASADSRAVDGAARGALILPLVAAVLWLVAGCALVLVHSIQLHTPTFLSACAWFTFGRIQAAFETALLYGWTANAGFAIVFWLLGRLGGATPRGTGLMIVGSLFWNAAVGAALVGIFVGDLSGHALLQMPGYTLPILLASCAAVAVAAVLAWADRRDKSAYSTQWYALAAVFTLPWLLSVATAMLYASPGTGVSQAVVAAWTGQGLINLWVGPVALAIAYYVLPKVTCIQIPCYNLAKYGFWILFVCGPWLGTRDLVGGPFPAWIPAVGVAASVVMLAHVAIVAINLKALFTRRIKGSVALRFTAVSVASYLILGVAGLPCSLFPLEPWVQFTYVNEARTLVLILGVFTPAAFAAVYFMMPRTMGRAWPSDGLIVWHFWLHTVGLLLVLVGFVGAGLDQSSLFWDNETSLGVIVEGLKPWFLAASGGLLLQLGGAVFLAINLVLQVLPGLPKPPGRANSNSQTRPS